MPCRSGRDRTPRPTSQGRGPYRPPRGRRQPPAGVLLLVAAALVGAYYGLSARWGPEFIPATGAEVRALRLMEQGIEIVAAARLQLGIPIDPQFDPNGTGLIGVEYSSVTTTLGDLAAKRTSTNPLWAAAVVRWMKAADVGPGDVVWATFSGSFPGFNLAVLSAAEAVGAELLAVSSLSASSWGGNIPEFLWPAVEQALHEGGLVGGRSVALTLGGDYDRGPGALDLFGDGETALRSEAEVRGLPLLEFDSMAEAVGRRIDVLTAASPGRAPALYVNVGGGHAAFGECLDGHLWPSGLSRESRPCPGGGSPGMLYVMAERGVPVLHLLNAKSLAVRIGIPVDGRFRPGD